MYELLAEFFLPSWRQGSNKLSQLPYPYERMLSSATPEIPAQLLSSIYEASTDPARWADVAHAVTRWVGGAIPSLQARRLGPNPQTFLITSGVPASFYQSYVNHYAMHDPHLVHVERLDVGRAHLSREVIPDAEYLASTFYNEWCRPMSVRDVQGAVLLRNRRWAVTFAVGHDEVPLDHASLARLNAVVPHMTRALRLGFRFDEPSANHDCLQAMAQENLVGWLKLDRSLTVIDHDRWPDECSLTSLTHVISLHRGALFAVNAEDHEHLQSLILRAIEGRTGTLTIRGTARPLRLVAVPSSPAFPFSNERCATLVYALPEQAPDDPRVESLPPSLRKVADALRRGLSDKEIAHELGLTLSTARTYVARVMARLHVKDRRALIRG